MQPSRRGFLKAGVALASLPALPLPILASDLVRCDPRDVLLEDHESGKCACCDAVVGMTDVWWYVVNFKDGTRMFICQPCGDEWAGSPATEAR